MLKNKNTIISNFLIFKFIVLFHFLEHSTQIYQLYFLHWSRPDSLGILGLLYPFLIKSELLHLSYAIYMLGGLYYFKSKIKNHFWNLATNLQSLHLIEHLILMFQFLLGFKPTGIGGLWFPRIELHFFYNLIVLIPMLIAIKKINVKYLY